mgnify:CR=1 FL=1
MATQTESRQRYQSEMRTKRRVRTTQWQNEKIRQMAEQSGMTEQAVIMAALDEYFRARS